MNLIKAADLEAWSRSLTARTNIPGFVRISYKFLLPELAVLPHCFV
jgi:hypothetical protein